MLCANHSGDIVMGVGTGHWSLNNRDCGPGASPGWFVDEEVVVVVATGLQLVSRASGEVTADIPMPVPNLLLAGGGVWATNRPRIDLVDSLGRSYPSTAALIGVGPDGSVCYQPDSHGAWEYRVREASGQEWTLPTLGHRCEELQLLGGGRAIWRDEGFQPRTVGIPAVRPVGRTASPRALFVDGRWWILYWAYENGPLVLRPFDEAVGYRLTVPGQVAYGTTAYVGPDRQTVAAFWAVGPGEQPGELAGTVRSVTTPRVDVTPPTDVPPIGRPCWLGWFEFATPPELPPGNCTLPTSDLVVRDRTGAAVAQYVAAEVEGTIPALEAAVRDARARRPGVPVVAYWPRGFHTGPTPDCDWLGVEAYCGIDETPETFENRLRATLSVLAVSRIALIAQCYTSNARQTADLVPLVPVYARLARDDRRIVAILAFSDAGRATGLVDHPEARPAWTALAAGIPGQPAIERTEEFMEPWRVNVKAYDKVIGRGRRAIFRAALGNGVEVEWQKEPDDTVHLAVYKDGELQDRSGLARKVEIEA